MGEGELEGGRYKFLRVASNREREHSAANRIPNSAMSAILMQFRYVVISVEAKTEPALSSVFPIFLTVKSTIDDDDDEYFSRIAERRRRKTRSPAAIAGFQSEIARTSVPPKLVPLENEKGRRVCVCLRVSVRALTLSFCRYLYPCVKR